MSTTQPKIPPSLYRGRYYTKENYELLIKMLKSDQKRNTLYQWILMIISCKKPETIKRKILSIKNTPDRSLRHTGILYDMLYNTCLEDIVPHLNDEYHLIVSWRLQINK